MRQVKLNYIPQVSQYLRAVWLSQTIHISNSSTTKEKQPATYPRQNPSHIKHLEPSQRQRFRKRTGIRPSPWYCEALEGRSSSHWSTGDNGLKLQCSTHDDTPTETTVIPLLYKSSNEIQPVLSSGRSRRVPNRSLHAHHRHRSEVIYKAEVKQRRVGCSISTNKHHPGCLQVLLRRLAVSIHEPLLFLQTQH